MLKFSLLLRSETLLELELPKTNIENALLSSIHHPVPPFFVVLQQRFTAFYYISQFSRLLFGPLRHGCPQSLRAGSTYQTDLVCDHLHALFTNLKPKSENFKRCAKKLSVEARKLQQKQEAAVEARNPRKVLYPLSN